MQLDSCTRGATSSTTLSGRPQPLSPRSLRKVQVRRRQTLSRRWTQRLLIPVGPMLSRTHILPVLSVLGGLKKPKSSDSIHLRRISELARNPKHSRRHQDKAPWQDRTMPPNHQEHTLGLSRWVKGSCEDLNSLLRLPAQRMKFHR